MISTSMRIRLRVLLALGLAIVVAGRLGAGASTQDTGSQPGTAPDAAAVDRILQTAEGLLREQKGDQALPLFERALAGARALTLAAQEAEARCGIGEIQHYRTQYASARDHAQKALEIYERLNAPHGIGRASLLFSSALDMLGSRRDAQGAAERAVAAFESINDLRGRAVSTLQLLRVAPFDLATERPWYERAISDAHAVNDRMLEGQALHSLGDHLFTEGQYEASLETLMRAETVLTNTPDIVELGTVYNSIGRVYRAHGRMDEALKSQLKALELHQKANTPFFLMQSLNAVATVYQRIDNNTAARTYYERALAIAERSSSQRVQDLVRANLAGLLIAQGEFARGASALEEVIAHGVDVYPSRRYSVLSSAYGKMSRREDALDAATHAVDACRGEENACVTALARRSQAYLANGNGQAALADVHAALAELETVRTQLVPLDFFKQDFHRAQEDVYSLAIGLQMREKQDRVALETAELARSRAFLDLLASRDVRFKEKDQGSLASLRENARHGEPPPPLAQDASRSSVPLTLRGTERTASIPSETKGAALELRSLVSATPSAADDLVATAARLRSTLLVYWVGEDELFIWVVPPDGMIQSRRVSVLRSKLLELIRSTSPFPETEDAGARPAATIATRGSSRVALQAARPAAWRALYAILIDPVRSALPRTTGSLLTIVPQGPLLNLSFAALQSAGGRYLLEDFTLHYAPAGAVLQFTAPKRRADARQGQMLVVADPMPPVLSSLDRPLARLPGARQEASAIAKLLPPARLTVLEDVKASEASTRDSVAGKAVLHFATHAIVSDDDPFGSFLALGRSGSGTRADGLLSSQEVYGMDLNADLVVLSACRSAGGRVTGDGISAFARAFIYAGTASLVASLWDVADEPTNRLLPDFYRAWFAGESKGRALRNAQLRLLRDLRAGRVKIATPAGEVSVPEHPVFWAGFALFGEPD